MCHAELQSPPTPGELFFILVLTCGKLFTPAVLILLNKNIRGACEAWFAAIVSYHCKLKICSMLGVCVCVCTCLLVYWISSAPLIYITNP